MKNNLIKVLIAEDSKVVEHILRDIFSEENGFRVIGCAEDGKQAYELTKSLCPDVVTMDIEMPNVDGFEATKMIMTDTPTPIVVISSHVNSTNLNVTFNALEAGALSVIDKPKNVDSDDFERQKQHIITTVQAMSEVHVIRRRKAGSTKPAHVMPNIHVNGAYDILAFGASTGGPEALKSIISGLPASLSVPVVIVQHITPGFINGLIDWLQSHSALHVELISHSEQVLTPGTIYFAPDDRHLTIKQGPKPIAMLDDLPLICNFRPSVNRLFSSLASSYPKEAVAGLLTGMGSDGAEGLLEMKQAGCHTFIQDELSSIVFGMPGVAKQLDAYNDIVGLDIISEYVTELFKEN